MPHRKNIADFYALLTGAVIDTIHFSLRLWLIRNTTCLIKEPIDGSSAHIQVIAHALRRSDNKVDFVVDSHALVQKCRLPEVALLSVGSMLVERCKRAFPAAHRMLPTSARGR